jgi:hypothetical protein
MSFATAPNAALSSLRTDDRRLFWSNGRSDAGEVRRYDLGDGGYTVLARANEITAIALDDDFVYWADNPTGSIHRIAKAGGDPMLVTTFPGRDVRVLVVDRGTVYFTGGPDFDNASIYRAPACGGTALVIGRGFRPVGLALSATHLYYASGYENLFRIPR